MRKYLLTLSLVMSRKNADLTYSICPCTFVQHADCVHPTYEGNNETLQQHSAHNMKIVLQIHFKTWYPLFYRHCFRVAVWGIIVTHIVPLYMHTSNIDSSYSYSSCVLLLSLICENKGTLGTFES
jgi:hypothetical protein